MRKRLDESLLALLERWVLGKGSAKSGADDDERPHVGQANDGVGNDRGFECSGDRLRKLDSRRSCGAALEGAAAG